MADEYEERPEGPPTEDAFPPILKQQWFSAPDLPDKKIEKPPPGTSTAEPPVPHPAWSAYPGTFRDFEGGLLADVNTQITEYMALREEVERVKGTIFMPRYPPDHVQIQLEDGNTYSVAWLKEHLPGAFSQCFGANAEQSAQYGDMLENALVSAANVIYLVGEMTQMLNEAAQGYVAADINARMPEHSFMKDRSAEGPGGR